MRKKKRRQSSGIGGQAVLEGIMMKNKDKYAVAVRKPDGQIEVEVDTYQSIIHESVLLKIPFIRGVFNFIDSMILGMKSLNFSAEFYEDEGATDKAADKALNKVSGGNSEKILTGIVTIFSIVLAVAIFMVLPWYLTSLFQGYIRNDSLMAIIEGVIRIVIFIVYVLSISLMKDIRRLYRYHGAEHKCINCIEKGRPLTVHNVMRSSKKHKRCGTSFMLLVMLISIVLFFFIRVENPVHKVLLRIALIPVIAGISYEVIRLAGRSDNILVKIISAPGMLLQGLTTREPDESMVEVAIAAVEAVFDWKAYLYDEFGYEIDDSWLSDEEPSDDDEWEAPKAEADEETEIEYEAESEEVEVGNEVEVEAEIEPEVEAEPEVQTDDEVEIASEPETAFEAEIDAEAQVENESKVAIESESEIEPSVETESEKVEIEHAVNADVELASELAIEPETQVETESEVEAETESEIESLVEMKSEDVETETVSEEPAIEADMEVKSEPAPAAKPKPTSKGSSAQAKRPKPETKNRTAQGTNRNRKKKRSNKK